MKTLGFDAVYDERVFERGQFVAGSPATRAAVIEAAWRDPSIRALIAIRGGYGSAQLLPLLDVALMRDGQKNLRWLQRSDGPAVSAPAAWAHLLPRGHDRAAYCTRRNGLRSRVFSPRAHDGASPIGELAPASLQVVKTGEARGPLVGGTLTQLISLLGTPWAYMPPAGCVLFIEDVAERPFRIDRMLTQLDQAGILAHAAALVFGEFPRCGEPDGSIAALHVIESFASRFDGPVLFGFPSGHTTGPTWTLPFGVEARVVTGATRRSSSKKPPSNDHRWRFI